jgi:hypothetical protein
LKAGDFVRTHEPAKMGDFCFFIVAFDTYHTEQIKPFIIIYLRYAAVGWGGVISESFFSLYFLIFLS